MTDCGRQMSKCNRFRLQVKPDGREEQGADIMHDRINILWFCADQMRYDTVHALGNPHINTPNLDRLVASGVAFTRTYA